MNRWTLVHLVGSPPIRYFRILEPLFTFIFVQSFSPTLFGGDVFREHKPRNWSNYWPLTCYKRN